MRSLIACAALLLASCGAETELSPAATTLVERSGRRAYDGAPPVIPHVPFGSPCVTCHDDDGFQVPNVGFAPPQPHESEGVGGRWARCRQCHLFRQTGEEFAATGFVGLAQVFRGGSRQHSDAPPVIPHEVFGRENCAACHTGPATRAEIRCTHPERSNCVQCHVPRVTPNEFER